MADLASQLQEYQIQLEQVEISLKSDPENDELLKLKEDLVEVIKITQELLGETGEDDESGFPDASGTDALTLCKEMKWKAGHKCMAKWREDQQYYPAVINELLDDGTCTVIFDGYKSKELVQVSQLMPRNKNANLTNNMDPSNLMHKPSGFSEKKRPLSKKELETRLREVKKKKREKLEVKIKRLDEVSEREKNKWKSFNTKLASKTWKGVVKKSKFELPEHHENKIGVGTNSIVNRASLTSNSSASASASHLAHAKAAAAAASSTKHK